MKFLTDSAVCCSLLLALWRCLKGKIIVDLDCLLFDGLDEADANAGVSL